MGQFVTTVTMCPLLGNDVKSVLAQNQTFQTNSFGQIIGLHTIYHTFMLNI